MDFYRHGTSTFWIVFSSSCLFLFGMHAGASSIVDRQYELETIGALRSTDNIDGLLADQLSEVFKKFLLNESRFTFTDLKTADLFFQQSKLSYSEIIKDPDILNRLARSVHLQSLIRTRVERKDHSYKFWIEWLYTPKMNLLAQEEFSVDEPPPGTAWDFSQF